jgi:hypothetical protein
MGLPCNVRSGANIGDGDLENHCVTDLDLIKPDYSVHIIRSTHASSGQTESPTITEMPVVIASVHEGPNVLYPWSQLNRHDLICASSVSKEDG